MIVGIDPRNDFAFKCVFGNEQHTDILIHLLNAVLAPPADQRVERVWILNPISRLTHLDDKLLVLDIKAQDQSGRLFDVEMQIVAHPGFVGRLLYYWAKMYGDQLDSADDYVLLRPVISICFLDGLLFPEVQDPHLSFKLRTADGRLVLSEDQQIHLFQLPSFVKPVDALTDALDLWLYFLNNGKDLDPDHLPPTLNHPIIRESLEILTMLTQDNTQKELYEAREKARRTAATWENEFKRLRKAVETSRAEGEARGQLIGQVRLCEQLLKREPASDEQLAGMSFDQLRSLAEQLRINLPQ